MKLIVPVFPGCLDSFTQFGKFSASKFFYSLFQKFFLNSFSSLLFLVFLLILVSVCRDLLLCSYKSITEVEVRTLCTRGQLGKAFVFWTSLHAGQRSVKSALKMMALLPLVIKLGLPRTNL